MAIKISVVITHFERPVELRRALASVLSQGYDGLEVLVIDDCSGHLYQADFNEVRHQHPEIKFICNSVNLGVQKSRNIGIWAATGEYIAFMDCDDEWLPGKLCKQSQLLSIGNADICSCGFYRKYGGGVLQKDFSYKSFKGDAIGHLLINAGHFQTSTLMCKTSVARGILFDENVKKYQDWDFVIRASLSGYKMLMVPEMLSVFHFGAKDQMSIVPRPDLACKYISGMQCLLSDRYVNYAYIRIVARMYVETGRFREGFLIWLNVGRSCHLWDGLGLVIIFRKTISFF